MDMPKDELHRNGTILCETHQQLKENLSPEMFDLHCKFVDALDSDYSDEVDFYFAEGFKLGVLIGIECMDE